MMAVVEAEDTERVSIDFVLSAVPVQSSVHSQLVSLSSRPSTTKMNLKHTLRGNSHDILSDNVCKVIRRQ